MMLNLQHFIWTLKETNVNAVQLFRLYSDRKKQTYSTFNVTVLVHSIRKNLIGYGAKLSINCSLISHTTSSASTHSHLEFVNLLDLYHIMQHQSTSAVYRGKEQL